MPNNDIIHHSRVFDFQYVAFLLLVKGPFICLGKRIRLRVKDVAMVYSVLSFGVKMTLVVKKN